MPQVPMDPDQHQHLQQAARDHLWMHFTRMSTYQDARGPDHRPRRGRLHLRRPGHGATSTGSPACSSTSSATDAPSSPRPPRKQAGELAFFPLWSYAHPQRDRARPSASPAYAPGDLNRVFFTTGGGEAVESAWKLAKNYFKVTGKPMKHKVISRAIAYHGTTQGALSITGLPPLKPPFEPLVPSTFRVPNTNIYRAPLHGDDPEAFGRWAADQIAVAIENEGPDTVAAVFLEPVQNAGGCFPPPPGYFQRVREICDEYDVLLVSDEVICAFGRLGHMFGAERYGYQPDIITCAKGITSGYAPLGAMIATDRLMEPFLKGQETFLHGYTFGGHPVSTAVGLANLDVFEKEGINQHVLDNQDALPGDPGEAAPTCRSSATSAARATSTGSSWSRTRRPRRPSTTTRRSACSAASCRKALFDGGLYCRADDRGDPVIQLVPAADLRPVALRRDGADPPQGPHRGLGHALAARRRRGGRPSWGQRSTGVGKKDRAPSHRLGARSRSPPTGDSWVRALPVAHPCAVRPVRTSCRLGRLPPDPTTASPPSTSPNASRNMIVPTTLICIGISRCDGAPDVHRERDRLAGVQVRDDEVVEATARSSAARPRRCPG